jgi:glutamate dehydrogenase (NADP+)
MYSVMGKTMDVLASIIFPNCTCRDELINVCYREENDYLTAHGGELYPDVELLKEVKEVKRARLTEYAAARPSAEYHEGRGVWSIPVDIALPCATQNELHLEDAKQLVANGCYAVAEGANMPTTLEATEYLQKNGILFAPGKASNAGGVATSALEMSQNSERLSWTFEEVDGKLQNIMVNIFHNLDDAAKRYGMEGNYVAGANIAGFEKVVDAMTAQGIV